MSFSFGDPFVNNGLVLYLDAGHQGSYAGTGTTWTDLTGKVNNGTLVNGTGYNSSNGGSLVFDGADDYVDLGNPPDLDFQTGEFTVEVWFNSDNVSVAQAIIGNDLDNFEVDIRAVDSTLIFTISNDGSPYTQFSAGFSALSNNTWYQFAISRIGTTLSCYLNGSTGTVVLNRGQSITTIPVGIWTIGARSDPYSLEFDGKIAIVRMYNRGLSTAEIIQNFQANRNRFGI